VENYGVGVAEIARQIGISTLRRFEDPNEKFVHLVNSVPSPPLEGLDINFVVMPAAIASRALIAGNMDIATVRESALTASLAERRMVLWSVRSFFRGPAVQTTANPSPNLESQVRRVSLGA
jgi:hypothetical protein